MLYNNEEEPDRFVQPFLVIGHIFFFSRQPFLRSNYNMMSIQMIDHEKKTNKSTASKPGPVLIGGGLMTILFSVEVFVFQN